MHEKVGVKTHCLTPLPKKWGPPIDPLDPVLPRSMPVALRSLQTVHCFKAALKTFLFSHNL